MISLGADFREFLELLNRHGVRYIIAGGFAVAVHGNPRYTKDIDVWLDADPVNAAKVENVIKEFGFGSLGLVAADFVDQDTIIQLGREPNRIDLLTSLKGLQFDVCYPSRLLVKIAGLELPFLDRESLILNKRAVARPRDLVDADELEN